MTALVVGNRPPTTPESELLLSPQEIKHCLAEGMLSPSLQHLLPTPDRNARITGVRLLQEKHRRDSSSLILRIALIRLATAVAETRDLVLHYPRRVALAESGAPST